MYQPFMGSPLTPKVDAQSIRREHLEQEANLRSLEIIYYVLSLVFVGLGATFLGRIICIGFFDPGLAIFAAALLLIAGFLFWVARQFKRLAFSAAVIGSVIAAIGLFAVPLGTLLGGLTLYSIWCRKGRYIFTAEYQRVIASTRDIECRPGGVILAFFILVAIFAGLVFLAIIFDYHGGLPKA